MTSTHEPDESRTPLDEAVRRIGDRWSLLIVDALLDGSRRFGELESEVAGVAPNILSKRLTALEQAGVVLAIPYSRRPLRYTYELTGQGRELAGALRLLTRWGAGAGGHEGPTHAACGTPVEARWFCPTCGEVVDDLDDEGLRFI